MENIPLTKIKHPHSRLYWMLLLVIFILFGLIVFANFWMYRLDMADLFSK